MRERVWSIVNTSEEIFEECEKDPRLWLIYGLRDPDRVFPKNQAQKKTKELPRIICSTSLVDQLVTRFFYQEYTDAEKEAYPRADTCKGIGFSKEHADLFGARMDERAAKYADATGKPVKGPVGSDVSGWDKNFPGKGACATGYSMRATVKNYDQNPKGYDAAYMWWSKSLCTNLYILDNGKIVVFLDNKVQRSGGFLTTSSNGNLRVLCAYAVGSLPSAAGDDCLEYTVLTMEELKEAYLAIGMPVRDVTQFSVDEFEFCSHGFKRCGKPEEGWFTYLSSYERMFFETAFSRKTVESDINWKDEIIDHPNREMVDEFLDYLKVRAEMLSGQNG